MWAEAEEIEDETRDQDNWQTAERKAARQAKIAAVPLGQVKKHWTRAFLVMISTIFGLWTPFITTTLTFQRMHAAYVYIRHRVCLCVYTPSSTG